MAGAYADNDAEAVSVADALLSIGNITILTTDYKTLANYSIATVSAIGLPYQATAVNLYLIVRTPAIVAYLTTSDLQFVFGLLRD
jgi:hypothetical protein